MISIRRLRAAQWLRLMHNAGVSRNEGLKVSAEREEIDLLAMLVVIEGLCSKTPVQACPHRDILRTSLELPAAHSKTTLKGLEADAQRGGGGTVSSQQHQI